MQTIAETQSFARDIAAHLSVDERAALIEHLARRPSCGTLVAGANGLRKLRWQKGSSGKSGGVRVVYYFHNESMPLYLLALFAKNEKANLSVAERQAIGKLIDALVNAYEQRSTKQ